MISLARGTLPFRAITKFAWSSKIFVFQTIPRATAAVFKFLMEAKRLLLWLVDSAVICILLLWFLRQIISGLLCVALPIHTQQDSRFSITPRRVWSTTSHWIFPAINQFFKVSPSFRVLIEIRRYSNYMNISRYNFMLPFTFQFFS